MRKPSALHAMRRPPMQRCAHMHSLWSALHNSVLSCRNKVVAAVWVHTPTPGRGFTRRAFPEGQYSSSLRNGESRKIRMYYHISGTGVQYISKVKLHLSDLFHFEFVLIDLRGP